MKKPFLNKQPNLDELKKLLNELKTLQTAKIKIKKLIDLLEQEDENGLNYYNELTDILDKENIIKLKNYTEQIINMPFIWIAIVSNINLNKYARLEEEYAHKESLAK